MALEIEVFKTSTGYKARGQVDGIWVDAEETHAKAAVETLMEAMAGVAETVPRIKDTIMHLPPVLSEEEPEWVTEICGPKHGDPPGKFVPPESA